MAYTFFPAPAATKAVWDGPQKNVGNSFLLCDGKRKTENPVQNISDITDHSYQDPNTFDKYFNYVLQINNFDISDNAVDKYSE